jgi:hypothetical protein
VRRRRSKPLNPSTLVGGGSVRSGLFAAYDLRKQTLLGLSTNDCYADLDETALAVLARVADVSDKSKRGDFVN